MIAVETAPIYLMLNGHMGGRFEVSAMNKEELDCWVNLMQQRYTPSVGGLTLVMAIEPTQIPEAVREEAKKSQIYLTGGSPYGFQTIERRVDQGDLDEIELIIDELRQIATML